MHTKSKRNMVISLLTEMLHSATVATYPELCKNFPLEVVPATHEKFGHYQFNSAMKLAKQLGLPPRKIAEAILKNIKNSDIIEKSEVAGAGFINITLKTSFICQRTNAMLQKEHLAIARTGKGKKIVIDFSSPNVAKEMHVGHLRSTIIGDCLANLFEFLGYDVLRLNHIGDWGTSFGMLIAYMKEHAGENPQSSEMNLAALTQCYKRAKKLFDEDPEFKKRSQRAVVALQSGDAESLKTWHLICDTSKKAYQEIYDLLDISIVDRGESFYNPFLEEIVADMEKKQLVTLSHGAKCVFIEGFQNRGGEPFPFMIQKSDGGYNYDTTDLASIRHRIDEEKADRLIYVTDAGQSLHFQMLFETAVLANYLDLSKVSVNHVTFGLVLGSDGKKFRSRSGDTERLMDLLSTAIERADTILAERSPEMDDAERKQLAQTLGIAAIKYADLSTHRSSDYVFSYDKMLKFEGNTAAYLLYSYVRASSIKRKVGKNLQDLIASAAISLAHPAEIALGLHLARFEDSLHALEKDLLPHQLSEYLYALAEKFNAFFRDCRVEGTAEEDSRLMLCEAVAKTMKQGLAFLGIKTVEKM